MLNLFNISCLFSSGIVIISIFLGFSWGFTILSSFDVVNASPVLFRKTHLLYELLFWKHLVLYNLITVFYVFLQMIKIQIYPNIFSCSWFDRILSRSYLLISNVKLTSFSISNGLTFRSVNVMIVSSNSGL